MTHEYYMRRAIELAKLGAGWVSPNPLVGAVIVKDGRIIGEGYHERYGELHAERNALKNCTEDPKGAETYVTLEPCCHHGKQPPCTDALIAAGIKRVYMGSPDPNPKVAGKGIAILEEAGMEVIQHILEEECNAINFVFFKYIRTGKPYVVMKYAMTLDGKIATHTGASKWITGETAREHVHTQRKRFRGIMVGVGTVIADDPLLTCRMDKGRNPIRIICDTNLRTPLDSQIVKTAKLVQTIVATCETDEKKLRSFITSSCEVLVVPAVEKDGKKMLDLDTLMVELGKRRIDSILLEGGGSLNWSMLSSGNVDRIQAYIAPKLFGGNEAKTPVGGLGFDTPDMGVKLKNLEVTSLGQDILLEGEIIKADTGIQSEGEVEKCSQE